MVRYLTKLYQLVSRGPVINLGILALSRDKCECEGHNLSLRVSLPLLVATVLVGWSLVLTGDYHRLGTFGPTLTQFNSIQFNPIKYWVSTWLEFAYKLRT